jgi:hypothetical protein
MDVGRVNNYRKQVTHHIDDDVHLSAFRFPPARRF